MASHEAPPSISRSPSPLSPTPSKGGLRWKLSRLKKLPTKRGSCEELSTFADVGGRGAEDTRKSPDASFTTAATPLAVTPSEEYATGGASTGPGSAAMTGAPGVLDDTSAALPSSPGRRKLALRHWKRKLHMEDGADEDRSGLPPRGYLWLYIGRFQRWKRRYFVADETGMLYYYQNSTMRGARWAISLRGASVILTGKTRRQFIIVSGSSLINCRSQEPDQRQPWVDCIQNSIVSFATLARKKKHGEGKEEDPALEGNPSTNTETIVKNNAGVGVDDSIELMAKLHATRLLRARLRPHEAQLSAALQRSTAAVAALQPLVSQGSSAGEGGSMEADPHKPSQTDVAEPSLQEVWGQLRKATREVVEDLTLQLAEVEAENTVLSRSLLVMQRQKPENQKNRCRRRHSDTNRNTSESEADISEDEGYGHGGMGAERGPSTGILRSQLHEMAEAMDAMQLVREGGSFASGSDTIGYQDIIMALHAVRDEDE
eukprot:CAMPEP_0117688216 /NCGR_PEP_ID=MMETSP0804-20121206/23680_1 /TAXON_ID=1074897 /ORGANISM="Tetraselmis astigmatica, Strain CCMP880" /LENGTH=487 /DNA_ID=CAMNT_0005500591 /DNA_START=126 /DNA_END=1586 /DNA_ORIENTATION=-